MSKGVLRTRLRVRAIRTYISALSPTAQKIARSSSPPQLLSSCAIDPLVPMPQLLVAHAFGLRDDGIENHSHIVHLSIVVLVCLALWYTLRRVSDIWRRNPRYLMGCSRGLVPSSVARIVIARTCKASRRIDGTFGFIRDVCQCAPVIPTVGP